MAQIIVTDLKENTELDRQAMRAILGGYAAPRLGVSPPHPGHFQNPVSFSNLRLIPPAWELDTPR